MKPLLTVVSVLTLASCAHSPLSVSALDRTRKPAFISRIAEGAGPKSFVFSSDSSYRPRLAEKRIDDKEADRRLSVKLKHGVSRFSLAEMLRAQTYGRLPRVSPWTATVSPARVSSALQSFLVEEVPANAPDYELLRPFGTDAIVEFVVEEYGMRSKGGRAGVFISGYGRMFALDGGKMWFRAFDIDSLESGEPALDPFRVAQDQASYRGTMEKLVEAIAKQFAADLSPAERRAPAPSENAPGSDTLEPATGKSGAPTDDGDLPAPK